MVYQGPGSEPTLPPAVAGPAFLPDGTEVWVRPVQAADRELVREFLEQESPGSLEVRYFSAIRPVLAQEEIGQPSLPSDRLCLLVLGDRADRVAILGIGQYARTGPGSPLAEVVFVVAAPFRGRGIATLALARLARAARAFGILRFEARVRAENPELLEVFGGHGRPLHETTDEGEVDVQIPLGPEAGPVGASGPAAAGDRTRDPGAATDGTFGQRRSALRSRT